jgi:hypothetical protein
VALRPRLSPGVPLSRCGATVETGAAVVKADCPALEVGTLACSRVPAGPGLVSVSDRGSGAGERNGSLREPSRSPAPEDRGEARTPQQLAETKARLPQQRRPAGVSRCSGRAPVVSSTGAQRKRVTASSQPSGGRSGGVRHSHWAATALLDLLVDVVDMRHPLEDPSEPIIDLLPCD